MAVIGKLLISRLLAIGGLLLVTVASLANPVENSVQVRGVRVWAGPETTRLVFDVTGNTRFKVFSLDNPSRIVIDLSNTRLTGSLKAVDLRDSVVQQIRTGRRDATDRNLRIVLDVNTALKPTSTLLPPHGEHGYRLVIDLDSSRKAARPHVVSNPKPNVKAPVISDAPMDAPIISDISEAKKVEPPAARAPTRDIVIAIDAGHGGEDPGAIGPSGTREKDVALALARKLAELFRAEPGIRPVLIRDGDYYLGLRKRIIKARQHKADLFVSIHADAHNNPRASGSSVFALSQRGATNEAARWLAERENAADLVGGVSLDDKDNTLASVLLDLSQTATIEASLGVGSRVLDGLKRIGNVHKNRVEQAGFMVLKSPDIPSILVETAFISNPDEESKLLNGAYQTSLAQAIVTGVVAHFKDNPPSGTALAQQRRHTISRGDTLDTIAKRYKISPDSLRVANGLADSQVNVGQVLRIPVAGI